MIDVLVAGGGPAGLATAIGCTLAGLSVVVAEPRGFPIDKACGEGLMPGALPRLAALGVEVTGHPIRGIRYRDARHRADATFRHGDGLGVRRTELHAAFAARAAELSIPIVPARVTSLAQDATGVTAGDIRGRFLVAADGLHSPVRRFLGLDPRPYPQPRYGLRRHYRAVPWTDLVEVHFAGDCEAYVTPVANDQVGIAVLGAGAGGGLDARLAQFPELVERLAGASPMSATRGAGPLRQDVRRRVAGRVLLVGDAAGYLDALTGEGIGAAVAQASVLARCLAADRPGDYERAWRRVTRKGWMLTSGLLWSRQQPLLSQRLVPAAARLPWLFAKIVNEVAWA
ncbi:MAG TPA: NAD(P)/FAD-dependent oxidoreductase [Trebonia sp.]|nr:NAD(P)/FAD-dependent oxidoreductase [Trebonia sp.]